MLRNAVSSTYLFDYFSDIIIITLIIITTFAKSIAMNSSSGFDFENVLVLLEGGKIIEVYNYRRKVQSSIIISSRTSSNSKFNSVDNLFVIEVPEYLKPDATYKSIGFTTVIAS